MRSVSALRAVLLALQLLRADSLHASPALGHGGIARLALHGRCAHVCCEADGGDAATQLMAVEVPEGMQGGMCVQVQTPAGLMEAQIPFGMEAGESFQIAVPVVPESTTPEPAAAPAPELSAPPSPAHTAELSGPPPPLAPADERAAEAATLIAWVEQMGGSATGVRPVAAKLADGTSGVGLAATDSARRGDTLLSVPLSLGLSAESALRSSMGPYIAGFEPYLADYGFIALALIHERNLGSDSKLAPWLSACPALVPPAGFGELPLLWGADGISQLAAATTAGAVQRAADVNADFAWLQDNVFNKAPELFPPSVYTYDTYVAAVASALSRALPIAVDGDDYDPRPVLLPLVELVNHDGARPTCAVGCGTAKKSGLFGNGAAAGAACATLVASAGSIDANGALTVRYGGATSGELLLDHGFISEPVAVRPIP